MCMWSVKGTESHEWKIAVTMSHGWARKNMIFTSKKVTKMVECGWAMGIQMRGRNSRRNRARERERPSRRARKSRRYGRSDGRRLDLSDLWLQKGNLGLFLKQRCAKCRNRVTVRSPRRRRDFTLYYWRSSHQLSTAGEREGERERERERERE